MEAKFKFTRNRYGIKVKCTCMSCAFKEITRNQSMRICTQDNKEVSRCYVCDNWKMNKTLQALGREWGVVKDKETKEVIIY